MDPSSPPVVVAVDGSKHGRHAAVWLDRYLRATQDDDTDVRVYSLALPLDLAEMLATVSDLAQLVVVGMDDAQLVVDLIGPEARSLLRHTNVSVMVFRDQRRWSGGDGGEAHLTLAESAPAHGATPPPS